MKCKVMIARFPGNFHEDPDNVTWLMQTHRQMLEDPRIGPGNVECFVKSDTPITMVRNEAVYEAQQAGVDYLLMIDNDMKPDCPRAEKPFKPFWKTAFDWIYRREAPSVICSPYVGPNPHNNIYVFRYRTSNNYEPGRFELAQFTREEAAERSGIEWVPAIPTGLCLIDMRIFSRGGPNWFEYEWKDEGEQCPACNQYRPGRRMKKASTEDVFWSRNISNLWRDVPGAGCHVLWDSWSIHIKRSYCLPPELPHPNHMGIQIDAALGVNSVRSDEALRIMDGQRLPGGGVMDPLPLYVDLTEGGAGYGPEFRSENPVAEKAPEDENVRVQFWGPIPEVLEMASEGLKGDVLEIGPGFRPFPKATVSVGTEADRHAGVPHIVVDITSQPLPFQDHSHHIYCRHVIEDLTDPRLALSEIRRVCRTGYIECPSPLAELTRGVDCGGHSISYRGYQHHRWIVWAAGGILHLLPKLSMVESMDLSEFVPAWSELLKDPFYWNTYLVFHKELRFVIYECGVGKNFNGPDEYKGLLRWAVKEGIENSQYVKSVCLPDGRKDAKVAWPCAKELKADAVPGSDERLVRVDRAQYAEHIRGAFPEFARKDGDDGRI